mgnify:FL=1
MSDEHWHLCPGGLLNSRGHRIMTHAYSHRNGDCRAIRTLWCGCGANWRNNNARPYIRGRGL